MLLAAILVADGVEELEVTAPCQALAHAGWSVRLLSADGKPVKGYHSIDPMGELEVDGLIGDADPDDVDLLVVPGGLGGPDTLRQDAAAVDLVRLCAQAGTPIGVICRGPWVLLETDVLRGRTLACGPALRTDVTNGGATYVEEAVHVDDSTSPLLVSGRNSDAAEEFARTLVGQLSH